MKLTKDPVNRLIVASWNEDYKTIASSVKEKLGIDFTPEQIRGRKRNLRKVLGDNLENMSDDLFKEILGQHNFSGNWSHGWLKTDNASIFIKNKENIVTYEEIRESLISKKPLCEAF